jgi:hypothetical protein
MAGGRGLLSGLLTVVDNVTRVGPEAIAGGASIGERSVADLKQLAASGQRSTKLSNDNQ